MGDSELQASYSKNPTKYSESSDCYVSESVCRVKRLIQSLNDSEQEGLADYSHAFQAYSLDFLNFECVEIFVDSLIAKAKECLKKNVFNVNYFLCIFCGDVFRDPVTLKCGHTYSKKCVLFSAKAGSFDCLKCRKIFSYSYLSELKTDVVISSLIEKVWKHDHVNKSVKDENVSNSKCGQNTAFKVAINEVDLFLNFDVSCSFLGNLSFQEILKKGDILVNIKQYKEAVHLYLICSVFDQASIKVKNKAIKFLYMLLLNHTKSSENEDCEFSQTSSKDDGNNSSSDVEVCNTLMNKESRDEVFFLIKKFCENIEKLAGKEFLKSKIARSYSDKQDFECPLCMRILWEPITTPCGHTFCRICLYRCFDHQAACPLCKNTLASCLAERVCSTNELIELAIMNLFPNDYASRKYLFVEEMKELSNAGKDPDHVIPLFVCTIAFPTVPCPLHIFEPRYRLMIRQCMESGSHKFGMCAFVDNNIADYGTILEIKDVRYFPDGRSVVDTVGSRRFRVLNKGERDGYHTGAVEYLKDDILSGVALQDLKEQHDRLYKISQSWFRRLPQDTKHQILQHFGPMPREDLNYLLNPDGPSWFWWMLAILPIESKSQVLILSMTSLARRMKSLERILLRLDSSMVS